MITCNRLVYTMEIPLRFLVLGDSYTVGQSVDSSQRWPTQLRDALQCEGLSIEDPIIIAQTGWTSGELLTAIEDADPQSPFNLITLLIGVNDQYQGGDIETYQDDFRALLGLATNFAGGDPTKILVLSIPDWGETIFNKDRDPIQISAEIDQFNIINNKECQAAGIQYVDITPVSRQVASDPTMLASDGLHPSGKMYAAWVDLILPAVLQILQPQ